MRIWILCSTLLLTSCGMTQAISESRRILSATADSVEAASQTMEKIHKAIGEATSLVNDVRTGEFDWSGLIMGALGGSVLGGGGGVLLGRKNGNGNGNRKS